MLSKKMYFVIYETRHSGGQAEIRTKKEVEDIAADPDNMDIFALMTTDTLKFKNLQSVDHESFAEITEKAMPWEVTKVKAKIRDGELYLKI